MDFDKTKWHTMTLAKQLGNVGSDFERAMRWKLKGEGDLFNAAAKRIIEQLDLTLTDKRWRNHRRQEIARLRDETCRALFETMDEKQYKFLQKYFMAMAILARK